MSETMQFIVGQRVSLRIQTGNLPVGLEGEVTGLEPPDRVWVLFKDVSDEPGFEDASVKVYATDIQPAVKPKKRR
jgi:hypothetical protein